MKIAAVTIALGAFLAISAEAQMGAYLDEYIVKVKPEKHADFEAIAKKIVDANRKNKGDNWLALDTMYGDADTMAFVSSRKDLGSVETANQTFLKALKDAYGDGAEATLHDFYACLTSSRGEIRKRRPDLSSNAPTNEEDYAKLVGEARYIRTLTVHFKPGHASAAEEMFGMAKAANDKKNPSITIMISQSVVGDEPDTFYVSRLGPSMASLDLPSIKELLGDQDAARFEKILADSVSGAEARISRFRPELSNPPAPIVEVSRDFWTPQPATSTAARAKKKTPSR